MRVVDLRSDTVTTPTEQMRRAMAQAQVGDDVYGEDPTVNTLEEEAASILGMEAALFVPSGTMGNQLAIMGHCRRGEEVLVDSESHILHYELAASAVLAGVQLCSVKNLHSEKTAVQLAKHIRPKEGFFPLTRLLCLENTHNRLGGVVFEPRVMRKICARAREHGLKVHLDGARIFNAASHLRSAPSALTQGMDSVMACFSKGLGAPVGSVLAGTKPFILRARINRKILGGGMRQAGILAAAGLMALRSREHLQQDHENARYLAEKIVSLPGIKVDMAKVQTNMVLLDVGGTGGDGASFVKRLEEKGIKASDFGGNAVRLVTHRDVSRKDVEHAAERIHKIFIHPRH